MNIKKSFRTIQINRKKPFISEWPLKSAQDKTRTCTPIQAPAPQADMSTNSTTWAKK